MAVAVSDVITLIKNYSRNQSLSDARGISIVDTAADYVLSQIGAPGYESQTSFEFFDDQSTYSAPVDFGEEIYLRFDDDELNKNQRFEWRPAELLFERVKAISANTRLWGSYVASGSWLLYILAKNSTAGMFIDSMDDATLWTASDDATNLVTDTFTKKEGNASTKFDVNVSLSGLNRATISRTFTNFDLSTAQDIGYFKCYIYLPTVTNFTSISLNWGNDASDYFKSTVTAQQDGTAFAVGWNNISFPWLGSTQVGTVNTQQISRFWFNFDYTVAFTSINSFRVDYLRMVIPDLMDMSYYTSYKGKSATGSSLSSFSATTDVFLFPDTNQNIKQMIAVQGAVILNPQILVDDKSVRQIYNDFHTVFARRYPRKRSRNLLFDPLLAKTSEQF